MHARHSPKVRDSRPCRRAVVAPRSAVKLRADPDEEDFEKRLAKLNKSKVPTGVSRKDLKKSTATAGTISILLCCPGLLSPKIRNFVA